MLSVCLTDIYPARQQSDEAGYCFQLCPPCVWTWVARAQLLKKLVNRSWWNLVVCYVLSCPRSSG